MNAKTRISTLAFALIAVGAVASATAAEPMKIAALGDVSGKVLVNQGRGFVSAKPGMEIRTGDRIVALDGASAQVVYGDGCVTDLRENNLLSVDGKGCATKPVNPRSENIKLAQAIGAGGAAGGGAAGGGAVAGGGAAGGGMLGLVPVIGGAGVVGLAIHGRNQADSDDLAPISAQ